MIILQLPGSSNIYLSTCTGITDSRALPKGFWKWELTDPDKYFEQCEMEFGQMIGEINWWEIS